MINLLLKKELLSEKSKCFLNEIGNYDALLKGLKIIILLRKGKIQLKKDVQEIKNILKQIKKYINF